MKNRIYKSILFGFLMCCSSVSFCDVFVDGGCSWTYVQSEDGVRIVGVKLNTSEAGSSNGWFEIPEEIDGSLVTAIEDRAVQLAKDSSEKRIRFPASVRSLAPTAVYSDTKWNLQWAGIDYSYDVLPAGKYSSLKDVLFLGERPVVMAWSSWSGANRDVSNSDTYIFDVYESQYSFERQHLTRYSGESMFTGVNVYVVEGEAGWNVGEKFCGGIVSMGATKARISVDENDSRIVRISSTREDARIYYTTDGSMPTENSQLYTNPLFLTEETVVRAIVKDAELPFVVDALLTCKPEGPFPVEKPSIEIDSELFLGVSQDVVITTSEETVVRYTLDGTDPSATNGTIYHGAFKIYDSCMIKAIAMKDGWKDSEIASVSVKKENKLGPAINLFAHLPESQTSASWTVDTKVTRDGKASAKSGVIKENEMTSMQVTVRGAGRVSFWWKAGCEEATDGEYYDYGCFRIGTAEPSAYIAGSTDWQKVVIDIPTTGKHVLKWEYHKDDAETIPPDCIWVDQVQWMPDDDSGVTLLSEVPVKYSWLSHYNLGLETDFEIAAEETAANGHKVWECYVSGEDPTDKDSKFAADIKVGEDGKPIVEWSPDLGEARVYKILGSTDLKTWVEVPEGKESDYNFFKVTVEMK